MCSYFCYPRLYTILVQQQQTGHTSFKMTFLSFARRYLKESTVHGLRFVTFSIGLLKLCLLKLCQKELELIQFVAGMWWMESTF